jgi:hypothetical protein
MTTNRTVPQRVVDWSQAFNAIAGEIITPGMREIAALAQPSGSANEINLGVAMSKIYFAQLRAAAVAAAMITSSGVSRPVIDIGSEDHDEDAPLTERGGLLDG